MSSDAEKPFDATPQRLTKAKREGNVARSSELGANVAFAAAGAVVVALAPLSAPAFARAMMIASSGSAPLPECAAIAGIAVATIAAAALAGSAASMMQTGGLVVVPVAVKPERLNPVEGVKRMLSRETLAHAFRAAVAFAVAAGAMSPSIVRAGSDMLSARTAGGVAVAAWQAAQHVAVVACATGLLFAGAEYAAARGAWLRKLRMSFEERKREAKEQDGDPFARGRRRAMHRSLLRGSIAKVREASFVVVNPTHVAVALQYRPPDVPVPRVLVRAADAAARRVRDIAARYDVPVVENVGLARALYHDGRIGAAIGVEHYIAVAEVVAALVREREHGT